MALVMAAGWLFRLRAYWFNRSLWMDEAALALNLTQASLVELLTKPLQNDQSAPLGFLAATKLLIELVSESEKVLRLLPLGAGLVTVILAGWPGGCSSDSWRFRRSWFITAPNSSSICWMYASAWLS
jgi:hypothetical protein